MLARTLAVLAGFLLATPVLAQPVPVALEPVSDQFEAPVFLTSPPGDPRLFVVEQPGRIRVVVDGAVVEQPFLDVGELVTYGGEQGLLGLAFHPDYATNGRFFVNYTDRNGDTQVAGYTVSDDPAVANPDSAAVLFSVEQPYPNHNGGWIGFGPDGLLYIGMGDGGAGGDPHGNGQNPEALLGKILRIDVDGGGPEIFASGVRNPWRNAFDGDAFYIADVGQNAIEEISVIGAGDAGANLGWNTMEGDACFSAASCEQAGLVLPVAVFSHSAGWCSITGGYVYRGAAIPELAGHYVFADYCGGIINSFRYEGGAAEDAGAWGELGRVGSVTSFGVDSAGELYVVTGEGLVAKLVPGS
jgi:glucose/arabinose dehydrogenase